MANVIGGLFQSYATSGSFSRSAVNYQSGVRTGFASVVASLVIAATLLWLTPLLYYLPQATLAVVIIAAVCGLVRIQPLMTAWRIKAYDGLIGVATFVGTLVLAPNLHLGLPLAWELRWCSTSTAPCGPAWFFSPDISTARCAKAMRA